jgi:hypothetical protein
MTETEKRAKLEAFGMKYKAGEATKTAEVTTGGTVPPVGIPRTNPTRPENEFMMNLMILRNTLAKNAPAIRERAKRAGRWTWRDIRLMFALVSKVQDQLLETMPASRDDYYRAYARGGHYELVMNGPVRGTRYVLVSDRHLAALTEAAMESECVMCFREGSEIGKCPLRAALLECAPPTQLQDGLWQRCEYRQAASQVLNDQEVTI